MMFPRIHGHAATLVWDPNTEKDLGGYFVYAGSGEGLLIRDVGKQTNFPILPRTAGEPVGTPGKLEPGRFYTFFVTAYSTNGIESEPSQSVPYFVSHAPAVIESLEAEPADGRVRPGDHFTVKVSALSTAPLSFQWFKGSLTNPIPGATHGRFIVTNASSSDAGEYFVQVTSANTTNTSARLEIAMDANAPLSPPLFTAPLDETRITVFEGFSAELVVNSIADPDARLEWWRVTANGPRLIAGANQPKLALSPASPGDAGVYFARIETEGRGGADSEYFVVEVLMKPSITLQPVSQRISEGFPLELRVEAAGYPPLRYQWLKNGAQIDGATDASLFWPDAAISDAGVYTVLVSNAVGSVLSDPAVVLVEHVEPETGLELLILMVSNRLTIVGRGVPGDTYQIETSSDLSTWRREYEVTVDLLGTFEITPPDPTTTQRWFARFVRQ